MKCLYINLERAVQRRSALEANFTQVKGEGWTLTRIPAIDASDIADRSILGALRLSEKACFLSHRLAVAQSLGDEAPVFIVEDDTAFGTRTCAALDVLVPRMTALGWDLLYTDVGVSDIATMMHLVMLKQQIDPARELKTLDLSAIGYFAASWHVVAGAAKRKLHDLLQAVTSFDVPYDLYLRQLVARGTLSAHAVFPFVSTVSHLADESNIQLVSHAGTEMVANLFRRLICLEGRTADHAAALAELSHSLSPDSRAFGTLWAAMADKGFVYK